MPNVFLALQRAARAFEAETRRAGHEAAWRQHPDDGSCSVRVRIDYDDLWRGCEKEVKETVASTVESSVTFLTEQQKILLERSPREFLALEPRPESAELLSFEAEVFGGSLRVVEFTVAEAPESPACIRYVAVVPNLVQIERQIDGLHTIETATCDGPLAPLRVLLGVSDASLQRAPPPMWTTAFGRSRASSSTSTRSSASARR